jgi:hypothetical protein
VRLHSQESRRRLTGSNRSARIFVTVSPLSSLVSFGLAQCFSCLDFGPMGGFRFYELFFSLSG